MGSYNTTCQVTGHTIGPNTPVVGFFLKPQAPKADESHRPDEPLKSMFGQWLPVHLPVAGIYDDCGMMPAINGASQVAIEHGKKHADGFDFGEKHWEDHPLADHDSKYIYWQVRADVYGYLCELGNQHPEGLLSENRAVLETIFSDVGPDTPEYQGAMNFFAGLNVLGYGFREFPASPDQCASDDHERFMPLRKKVLIRKQTDFGPVTEIPGLGFIRCGLTGRPIRANEPMMVFPLVAREAQDFDDNGRLHRISDFGVSAHYEMITNGFTAWINEDGSIGVPESANKSAMEKAALDLIEGYSEEETEYKSIRKRARLSAMVVSKDVYEIYRDSALQYVSSVFNNKMSVSEMLVKDYEDMKRVLRSCREALLTKDSKKIEQFLETCEMHNLIDDRLAEIDTPEKQDLRFIGTAFRIMSELERLPGSGSPFYRTNEISKLFSTSSSSTPLDIGQTIRLKRNLQDYLTGETSGGETIDHDLDFLLDIAVTNVTFEHLGVGLRSTQACKLGVDPEITLKAWDDIEKKVLRSLERELKAWYQEMEY